GNHRWLGDRHARPPVADLPRQQRRGVEIDRLVDGHADHPHPPQLLQHLGRLDAHLVGELGDGDALVHLDDALVLGGRGDRRRARLLARGHRLLAAQAALLIRLALAAALLRLEAPAHLPGARRRRRGDRAGTAGRQRLAPRAALGDLRARGRRLDDRAHRRSPRRRRRGRRGRLRRLLRLDCRLLGLGGLARALELDLELRLLPLARPARRRLAGGLRRALLGRGARLGLGGRRDGARPPPRGPPGPRPPPRPPPPPARAPPPPPPPP